MANQRNITVLFSLIASMTIGALVLMALDHNGPSAAAAYSLSSYLRLDPVEEVVTNSVKVAPAKWQRVEITYSQTDGGNANELPLLMGLVGDQKAEYHFVICNGNGGENGQIQATDYWKLQRTCGNRSGIIRVCVISDGQTEVTDSQMQRTNTLAESLSRTFEVAPKKIRYPIDWQM
jgi:hypothetical protein